MHGVVLPYLIFVISTTSGACGEQSVMWRIFFHMTDCHVEKFLHMRNVKKIYHIEKALHMINLEQMCYPEKCGEICHVEKSVMWRNVDILLHMNKLTFFFLQNLF